MPRRIIALGITLILAIVVAPLASDARPVGKVPRVGVLIAVSAPTTKLFSEVFRQELGELGYVEGKTIALEYRVAEGKYERLPALAAELVGFPIDVLVTWGTPAALAAKHATSTIPIVFTAVADPDGCQCRDCKLWRGELQPKPRRKPDDVHKYLSPSAQKLVQMLLDRLANTRGGLTDRTRFLFESRKTRATTDEPSRNRAISRQQAWTVIKSAARRAQLAYLSRASTHSLRKSFAMNTLHVTGDMRKVMAGLGHRSQATTESYVRNDSREMFEALQRAALENSRNLEIGLVA